MSLLDDAGKIAQNFLGLDDLVLGQSLARGGVSQLGRIGLSASGPAVAINVAARAAFLGAQVASRAVAIPAQTATGVVPGADEAKALADKVSAQAKTLGERCSALAIRGVELAGGEKARNPITNLEWLDKQAAPGYTTGELFADTAFETLQSLATMPFSLGMDSMREAADNAVAESMRSAIEASLERLPGVSSSAQSQELRQGLMAVAVESGLPLSRAATALADAAARLTLTDARALQEEMRNGLKVARMLAEDASADAVPRLRVSNRLRAAAQRLLDHAPNDFIAALDRDADHRAPQPAAILRAAVKDSRALLIYFTVYPEILSLLGSDVMTLAAAGITDLGTGRSSRDDDDERKSPADTLLDSLVGAAENEDGDTPLFPRATVHLAQDLSYLSSYEKKSRDESLDAVQRVFGKDVRDRIANDVSLHPDLVDTKGRAREKKIRNLIRDTSDADDLSHQIDLCTERLRLLEISQASAGLAMTNLLKPRIEALQLFTSLAAKELALRGAARPANHQARETFLAWAAQQS